jgi:hypothetical protein
MTDLFKYNPMPWAHVRCGDNWDIATPSRPEDTGVGVVATVFARAFPFGAGLSCFA